MTVKGKPVETSSIRTPVADDNIISESAQKEAKKILKKLDLSIDDLVNYALQVHEDKGKSLNS